MEEDYKNDQPVLKHGNMQIHFLSIVIPSQPELSNSVNIFDNFQENGRNGFIFLIVLFYVLGGTNGPQEKIGYIGHIFAF